jgi:hypothetical protein
MKTRYLKKAIVSALCLTVMAVVIPSISMGVDCTVEPMFVPPSFDIAVSRTAVVDYADPLGPANNPASSAWVSVPTTSVELGYKIHADVYSQATHNDIFCAPDVGEPVRWFNVQAIHDGANILFKITYLDATKSDTIADIPLFHDSLAIGLPYPVSMYGPMCAVDGGLTQGGEILHMGTPCDPASGMFCCPMNLIFWRADKAEVENILANSPSSSIETPETDMGIYHTYQNWTAGTWTVIIGRVMINTNPPVNAYPFQAALPGTNLVDLLGPNAAQHIIFANWDGAIQERNGFKYVGVFGNLIIAP